MRVTLPRPVVGPTCPHCHQSMTGSYGHAPRCVRCEPSLRLIADPNALVFTHAGQDLTR